MDKLAQEIIDLMRDKQLNTGIDDYPALRDTLINNEFADELVENLTNPQTIKQSIAACGDKEQSCEKFSRRLVAERGRRQKLMIIRAMSVAAVVTALALFVFYPRADRSDITVAEVAEIINHEKPVIVMDNGECVDLADNSIKTESFEADGENLTYISGDRVPVKLEYNTLLVPSKYTFHITLSDKTEVFLNANSRLKYPVNFIGNTREVTLEGEAYFKVSKSDKPFIVNAKEISIKVYGTEFNVNTNKHRYIETLLVKGSVGVTEHNREIMMTPNQFYVLNTDTGVSSVETVDSEDILSWREGMFRFTNKPLELILEDIGAWYNLQFSFENPSRKAILFNVSLMRTQDVDEILKVLEASANITFTKKEGGKYLVK